MRKAGQPGLISTENQIHISMVNYKFTSFGLSQQGTKFEGCTEWEKKDIQGFVSIGNFDRESSSQIYLLKQDITSLKYAAYLNGRLYAGPLLLRIAGGCGRPYGLVEDGSVLSWGRKVPN